MTPVPAAPRFSRPLRIGHLTTVDMSLALLLATELRVDRAEGHMTFGISAPGPYVERVERLGVIHVPVNSLTRTWRPTDDLRAFRELVGTLRNLRLDVLHTHNPKTGVMGRIAGRLAGVPVVVNTCHGLWARREDPISKRAFVYGLEALAARFSDAELFQNAEDMATLRRALRPGRFRVVGNGVDLDRFRPDPVARERVRAELGIEPHEFLVGSVGRQVREKGLAEFAHSAARHRERATFVWIGPEDAVDPTAGEVRGDAVRFIGEREDMPSVYSALDAFVLASYREGFSRSGMEAAACGLPMVLTDIRGCREVGTDGEHLILVPPRDGDALADAVGRLLDDPGLRQRLGSSARTRALESFDQRGVAAASLETYAQVAKRKRLDWAPSAESEERAVVLHILPEDLPRGAQVYAGRLRDTLAGDPQQTHLVVTLFDAPPAAARADIALGVSSGATRRLGLDPRALARLRRTITEQRPGVIVAHGGEPLKYAVAAGTKVPIVYYRIGLSTAELTRPSRVALYRALTRRTARVVSVSRAVLEQTHDVLGVPRERLGIIPNGRNPEIYHPPQARERENARPKVLFVGQFERGKRPGLFIDVVRATRALGVDLDAAMVGDGPLRSDLEGGAHAVGVEILGRRTDVPDLLNSADVLVMTSEPDSEGMPGVVIEAGLSGLPVVSTAAAGVADVVVDGETGYVVDSDSAADLAERVATLLRQPNLREAMGMRARERCEEHFTLEATAKAWRSLVEELAAQGGSR